MTRMRRRALCRRRSRDLQVGDAVKHGDLLAVLFSVDVGNKKNDLFDALSQLRLDEEVLKRAEAQSHAAVPEVFLLNASRTWRPISTPSTGRRTR